MGEAAELRSTTVTERWLHAEVPAEAEGVLRALYEQLQKRFAAIQKEQDDLYESERQGAAKYFPPDSSRPTADDEPLKDLVLQEEHLDLLGVERSCTMGQLAEAVKKVQEDVDQARSMQKLVIGQVDKIVKMAEEL